MLWATGGLLTLGPPANWDHVTVCSRRLRRSLLDAGTYATEPLGDSVVVSPLVTSGGGGQTLRPLIVIAGRYRCSVRGTSAIGLETAGRLRSHALSQQRARPPGCAGPDPDMVSVHGSTPALMHGIGSSTAAQTPGGVCSAGRVPVRSREEVVFVAAVGTDLAVVGRRAGPDRPLASFWPRTGPAPCAAAGGGGEYLSEGCGWGWKACWRLTERLS